MPARSAFAAVLRRAHAQVAAQGYVPRGSHSPRTVNRWLELRRRTAVCEGCAQDIEVCTCNVADCGHPADETAPCAACGRCSACCQCRSVLTGHRRRAASEPYPFHGDASPGLPRYASVEMECGINPSAERARFTEASATLAHWRAEVHSDGSISIGQRMAVEVCSAPARGDAFPTQIREITHGLLRLGGAVNSTCGLHVHVDVRDLTDEGWVGALLTHARVEAALFEIVAPSRRSAHWCRPAADTILGAFRSTAPGMSGAQVRRAVERAFYGADGGPDYSRRTRSKHPCRYHAINVNATPLYGTLENRMHHGSLDRTKIANWTRVVVAVVEWGRAHGLDSYALLPDDPWAALMTVIPADLHDWCAGRRAALAR